VNSIVKKIFLSSEFMESENDIVNLGNTDVLVTLNNGKKYIASFFSYNYVEAIKNEHERNGEYLNGKYFWDKNMVLVRDCSIKTVEQVVNEVIDEGDFLEVFRQL